jgi:hypothetical protein
MIKFPKMHIAQSVVNRILNTAEEIASNKRAQVAFSMAAPNVPDPTLEGAALDMKMAGDVPPVSPPSDPTQAAMAGEALTGGDTSDAVIASLLS